MASDFENNQVVSEPENAIQSACMDALAVYFNAKGATYRQLWTYANQQGDEANRFCADLVGVIDNATLLLMEFKALNHRTRNLEAFDQRQYEEAVKMQNANIPLVYCYDTVHPLPYYEDPRPSNWPKGVLMAINATQPSLLKGKKPEISAHNTLLDWIKKITGELPGNRLQQFGEAIGCLMPNMARNKLLAVLYSSQKKEALALNQDDIFNFHDWLRQQDSAQHPKVSTEIKALQQAIKDGLRLTPKLPKKRPRS
ncbi:hypothetical protein PPH93_00750 [Achromobacter xylosoxidans]|uniref:hypothetical protein n=1 Tax=Alcaligenes xylosoxydans xylosoxydans TaxID=85698 RepID=UPI00234AD381|nr:hypothetical protein [Achromobacter xylosoxidans]MDC6160142.1 hypothetical protein [Achromobacter xylosoxidans]